MEVIKANLKDKRGIPESGLCIGVHWAGEIQERLSKEYDRELTIFSLRPDFEFLAYRKRGEEAGKAAESSMERTLSAAGDLDSITDGSVIFGVRGVPPQVREKAAEMGLEILADATCPYVTQQERAAEELLEEGYHLVFLSSPSHHGIPRIRGIAKKLGRRLFIVEKEEDVEDIRLNRTAPLGVIVQTTFWMETYSKIMTRILERFSNVRIRNTACIDSLQRLPEVARLSRETDVMLIVGWNDGMTNRMLETARQCSDHVYKIKSAAEIQAAWFDGLEKVGVIGSNETPDWMVDEAVERVSAIGSAQPEVE
ncbi:hypothetical protein MYX82_07940 [Acidobacteria bacterium AH-259-D05]|nr:hypothetical protein [Acidobacteria bacterium AH-259-D05]